MGDDDDDDDEQASNASSTASATVLPSAVSTQLSLNAKECAVLRERVARLWQQQRHAAADELQQLRDALGAQHEQTTQAIMATVGGVAQRLEAYREMHSL